jgi:hypothetical protein
VYYGHTASWRGVCVVEDGVCAQLPSGQSVSHLAPRAVYSCKCR